MCKLDYIIIGLLGGIVIGAIIYVKNLIQEKQFERNFPISGQYLTKFDDEKNGEIVTFTAPAELKQKGNKINGYTHLSEGEKRWALEGQISDDGYFYGIYHAIGITDKGIGNFFLRVDRNRNMFGIWSGFDAENNKINSGKYIFIPHFQDTIIEEIATNHISHMLALSDQQLGEHYLTNDILDNIIKDKDNYFGKVAIDSNNKIIGFYLCYIIDPTQIEFLLNISAEKIPRVLKSSSKIGVLKTIVISENIVDVE